jgi:RHS repeat-associated protein
MAMQNVFYRTSFFCTLVLMAQGAAAQYLGPATVTAGQVTTYTCLQCTGTPGTLMAEPASVQTPTAQLVVTGWKATLGTIQSTNTDANGTSTVTVLWNQTGAGFVEYSTTQGSWGQKTITVNACTGLEPPTFMPVYVCPGGTAALTAVPGSGASTVRWYTAATGGTHVFEGTTYNTPALTANTTYYVSSYQSYGTYSCTSARVPVTVTVATPAQPLVNVKGIVFGYGYVTLNASFAYGNPNAPNPPMADNVRWYGQATGGTALASGFTYTTPTIITATTYYATAIHTASGCESTRKAYTVQPPTVYSNQVQATAVRIEGIKDPAQVTTLTEAQKAVSVSHLDGFMRPVQQIVLNASLTALDLVQPIEYDNQGRASKAYLPYTRALTSDAIDVQYTVSQQAFYNATGDKIADDAVPSATAVYEASPLGRVREQGNVGADFQPGSGHTTRIQYSYNDASVVRKFTATGSSAGFYAANTLTKQTVTDANGNRVISYTDTEGRTILKQQQLDKTVEGVLAPYLETYFIYDELNRTRFIISPKGVAVMKNSSWLFTAALREQYVHEFVYDYRGRLVEKKVPGQVVQYYIYDKLNRLVLVQDGLLRAQNKWIFVKYDRRHRPVMQGLYRNATQTTRAAVQGIIDALYTSSNATYPENSVGESRGTSMHGYSNVSFPKTNADNTAVEVLGVNYYESYDFDYNGTRDFKYDSLAFTGQAATSDWIAPGLPTGSKQLVLGTTTWLYAYTFYDKQGRVVQSRSNNHLNPAAIDNMTTAVYDFEGKLLAVKGYHNAGTGRQTTVVNRYTYDDKGRALNVYQNNDNAPTDQLLVQYAYNELGQLIDKKLHQTGGTAFLQSVDYRYSLQGWLKSINNATLTSNTNDNDDTDDYFGQELVYQTAESGLANTPLYNGNISAIKWKGVGATTGAADQRSYKYIYDKSGQLESATSQQYTGSAWTKEAGAVNEQMSYDQNGNILTLQRNQRKHQLSGVTASYVSEVTDNLTYSYGSTQASRLNKVEDASGNLAGFRNGANVATEYTYDVNGNTLSDQNKGISNVVYNFLGKADEVTFSDGRKLTYVYDAGGTKLTMKSYQGTTLQQTTDYVGGFVYENGVLSFFGSPGGRVVKNGATLEYQYALADHQGNTRVLFTSATPAADVSTATFESSTNTAFLNYGNPSSLEVFDHTDTGPTARGSQLLNGGPNSQVGLAKTLKVYPGDKVKIDAYAKYWQPTSNSGGLSTFASMLTTAFGVSAASTGDALRAYNTLNNFGGLVAAGTAHGSNAGDPKGFVTILLFDKNYNFLDAAWDQIDADYTQSSNIAVKDAFDHLQQEVTVREEGYVYIYLSNESPTQVDIYFDDVAVTHTKSRVLQYNEYYPLGLQTASSWTRENTTGNNFLYNQGNELNPTSGWYETFYRGYDASLGRFLQVDPEATRYADFSTYHYAGNNPVLLNDPSGATYADDMWQEFQAGPDFDPRETQDGGSQGWGHSTNGYADFPNSFYGSSRGLVGPGSGNHWSNSADFSSPTRDHFLLSSSDFESKYGVSDHEYHRSLVEQRAAEPFTGSVWDYGWAGGQQNEYHFVNGVAVGMTSYNIWEDGGGFTNHYDFAQQGVGQAMFAEFVQFFFGKELKQLNAAEKITWRIFDTTSDLLGANGSTMQRKDGTILIRIGARAMMDPKLLYHTVGHELIHASDYLNGNYGKWRATLGADYEWYGTENVMNLIMEHHAYTWDAAMEIQFGTDYGARRQLEYYNSELHDLSVHGY